MCVANLLQLTDTTERQRREMDRQMGRLASAWARRVRGRRRASRSPPTCCASTRSGTRCGWRLLQRADPVGSLRRQSAAPLRRVFRHDALRVRQRHVRSCESLPGVRCSGAPARRSPHAATQVRGSERQDPGPGLPGYGATVGLTRSTVRPGRGRTLRWDAGLLTSLVAMCEALRASRRFAGADRLAWAAHLDRDRRLFRVDS